MAIVIIERHADDEYIIYRDLYVYSCNVVIQCLLQLVRFLRNHFDLIVARSSNNTVYAVRKNALYYYFFIYF